MYTTPTMYPSLPINRCHATSDTLESSIAPDSKRRKISVKQASDVAAPESTFANRRRRSLSFPLLRRVFVDLVKYKVLSFQLNVKQVQNWLRLLKKNWRASEIRSAFGSGIEESLEAVNEQGHYVTLPGLVREYVRLEKVHAVAQKAKFEKEQEKAASVELCTSEIIAESNTRRAVGYFDELDSFSEPEDAVSGSRSADTCNSASAKSTPAKSSKEWFVVFEPNQNAWISVIVTNLLCGSNTLKRSWTDRSNNMQNYWSCREVEYWLAKQQKNIIGS
ncbi:hypothetical protein PHYSODRAFT_303789 [Phytophthora sojae]|uniref:Uncharacterized protein n=1 Tax=Phytophthora sojae (strain P6497) TaxID=1094619 RepID=G4ZY52_PHYSP|nr:hypothetical protein PHYSODRAFT_303789 [Phytophthora sojae]EGZ11958.1 hypothetical protein PHYSODRAFT_303789 [Phytophthora sojae]|eukprot:XP_009532291.1 hypothetical protein PHYSODRAFT_303789 [Phytophthora sojae]